MRIIKNIGINGTLSWKITLVVFCCAIGFLVAKSKLVLSDFFSILNPDWVECLQSDQIEALVASARRMPAAITADTLLRLEASGKICNKEVRLKFLEEAFIRAEDAIDPVPLISGALSGRFDTQENYLARDFSTLHIDTLSLRCRAVRQVRELDRFHAHQKFMDIAKPELPLSTCASILIPEISVYYGTVVIVANQSFTTLRNRDRLVARFLRSSIFPLVSSMQVAPVARVLAKVDMPREELQNLVDRYANFVNNLLPENRSFSTALVAHSPSAAISSLIETCSKKGIATEMLQSALHRNFIRNVKAPWCYENLESPLFKKTLGNESHDFNRILSQQPLIDPMSWSVMQSEGHVQSSGSGSPSAFWMKDPWQGYMMRQMTLRSRRSDYFIDGSTKSFWIAEYDKLVGEVVNSGASQPSHSLAEFYQVTKLLIELIRTAPNDAVKTRTAQTLAKYLLQRGIDRLYPTAWLARVMELIRLERSTKNSKEHDQLNSVLQGSGDSGIELYRLLLQL